MNYKVQGIILCVVVIGIFIVAMFVQVWIGRYSIWESKQIEKYCGQSCIWLADRNITKGGTECLATENPQLCCT